MPKISGLSNLARIGKEQAAATLADKSARVSHAPPLNSSTNLLMQFLGKYFPDLNQFMRLIVWSNRLMSELSLDSIG